MSTAVSLFSLTGVLGTMTSHVISISLDMHRKPQVQLKAGQTAAVLRQAALAPTHVPHHKNQTGQSPASCLQPLTGSQMSLQQSGASEIIHLRDCLFLQSNPLRQVLSLAF